jgi:hypothetical protein
MGAKRIFWHAGERDSHEVEDMETPVGIEPTRPRRRLRMILTLTLSAAFGGFLVSYALTPRYTSAATILVEGQHVPDAYVEPIITADLAQRVQSLEERVMATDMLTAILAGGTVQIGGDNVQVPGLEKSNPAIFKPADRSKIISQIQQNTQVVPVITAMSEAAANSPTSDMKAPSANNLPVPGFNVVYTDSDGVRAQKICDALVQLMVDANLHSRSEAVVTTTKFLSDQLAEAKRDLQAQEAQLLALSRGGSRGPEAERSTRCWPSTMMLRKPSIEICWPRKTPPT